MALKVARASVNCFDDRHQILIFISTGQGGQQISVLSGNRPFDLVNFRWSTAIIHTALACQARSLCKREGKEGG